MPDFSAGLNFRQLEIFNAVVEEGSTTRSAIRLGISQPAVSRNVNQLENDIGFALFDRVGGRLVPTKFALRLQAETKKAFMGIERVVKDAQDEDTVQSGKIQIAAVPSLSLSFLPKAIKEFILDYPEVSISIETRTSRTSLEMLANQRVNVALVSMPISHPGVKMEILDSPKAVCVVPKEHRLAKKEIVGIEDLIGENLIPMMQGHNSRHRLEELFAAEGYLPKFKLETSTIEMACVLVEQGLGITIVNEITAARHRRFGVELIPFKQSMNYAYAFGFPAKHPPSEITRIFVTYVKEYVKKNFNN
ncbi:LysR substrate-binding domain-containing protein [Sneathiella sp.]|jgi:DNA-binding transcriptional LysR family regulator|uniref:LysR substrate-binding domain-containing protein n=1 Tax=Sneathiella sp. TaxID=1964365 RepID=UPI0039E42CDA